MQWQHHWTAFPVTWDCTTLLSPFWKHLQSIWCHQTILYSLPTRWAGRKRCSKWEASYRRCNFLQFWRLKGKTCTQNTKLSDDSHQGQYQWTNTDHKAHIVWWRWMVQEGIHGCMLNCRVYGTTCPRDSPNTICCSAWGITRISICQSHSDSGTQNRHHTIPVRCCNPSSKKENLYSQTTTNPYSKSSPWMKMDSRHSRL